MNNENEVNNNSMLNQFLYTDKQNNDIFVEKKRNWFNNKIIVILLCILLIFFAGILLLLILFYINKETYVEIPIEKTPKELALEEKQKLKDALISEGYETGLDEIVYEMIVPTVGIEDMEDIYTFSFNDYSLMYQTHYSGNIMQNYYLISDTARGSWKYVDGDYIEIVEFTYDFKNGTTFCQRINMYGNVIECTQYSLLQNLRSYFMRLLNKYDIDKSILLYNY